MSDTREALNALKAAGWSACRREDVGADLAALEGEGYSVWPAAVAFLQSFSHLVVRYQRGGGPDTIWFDPVGATGRIWKSSVDEYSERAGVRLVPIGFASNDHLLVLLAEDGRLLGGYDWYFAELANDPIDLVQAMMEERAFPEL